MQNAGRRARVRSRSGERRGRVWFAQQTREPEEEPRPVSHYQPEVEPDWDETPATFPRSEDVRPRWLEVFCMWLEDPIEAHLDLELWRMRPRAWTGH